MFPQLSTGGLVLARVAEGETGEGDSPAPAKRLGPLKSEALKKDYPRKLALVEQLRILVEGTGRTSKSLAAQIHISASSMSKLLSGSRLPPRPEIEQLVRVCHVTDEVRAQLLRLHTAALAEAHPSLADLLEKADAYEEMALEQLRLQVRLEALTTQQHERRVAYDVLRVEHEATSRALNDALAQVRARQAEFDAAGARAAALLEAEQEARRADREELRRLRERMRRMEDLRQEADELQERVQQQDDEICFLRQELSQGAEELHAVRADRDQARCETVQLREYLIGLQWELAAAERGQARRHDEEGLVRQTVDHILDRWAQPVSEDESLSTHRADAFGWTASATGPDGEDWVVSEVETGDLAAPATPGFGPGTAASTAPAWSSRIRWRPVAVSALWSVLVSAVGAGAWALITLLPPPPDWTVPVGTTMVAGPTATRRTVYAGGTNGTVYALNAATGHTRWTSPTHLIPHTALAADDDSVFVSSQDGNVSALDAATGQPRWSTPLGPVTGPVTANGLVFAADHNGHIQALNATTGRPRWSAPVDKDGVGAGPVVSHGMVIAVGQHGRVHAFNAATGRRTWSATAAAPVRNELTTAGNRIFLSSQDGRVYALDLATGRIRWNSHTGPAHLTADKAYVYACTTSGKAVVSALEADTGHQGWRHTVSQHATDTAIAVTGDILYAAADGEIDVLYAPTGESGWGPDLPAPPKNNQHVSMVPVDGTLYVNTAHSVRAINMGNDPFPAAVHGYGAAGQ
ncbi:PQQ-binding-like beta-propeller repeat protein [Streptomyces sp. CC0208]|uniref:outer membrane protein assembly factor BamB family protein n=1 Tax=Streptomyces sp. CC0208 TaxID=2306165 RepID=UPI0013C4995F|nr:PQQ-binding-like beta-propeller repeat protein [Streptomyces sp. CC0208]